MSIRSREGGFSLLEILVAFSILALSLGVLLEIFSTSIRGVGLSDRYSRAAMIAESRLEAVGAEIPIEGGSYEGDDGDLYHWRVTLVPYPDPELEAAEPFAVEVEVSWGELGRERRIVLNSLRLAAERIQE